MNLVRKRDDRAFQWRYQRVACEGIGDARRSRDEGEMLGSQIELTIERPERRIWQSQHCVATWHPDANRACIPEALNLDNATWLAMRYAPCPVSNSPSHA